MAKINLTIPLTEEVVRNLNFGDVVYLTGTIYTARDEAHIHALEASKTGSDLPVDLSGSVIYHCGPIMKKTVNDQWEIVAAGPTTSSRMNSLEPEFIERFGARAIIGKGGMSKPTVEAMKKFGCVYLAFTGGAAILAANGIKSVQGVYWYELGMPEALWVLNADHFGPVIVAIDTHGNNIYDEVENVIKNNIPGIRKKFGLD